MDEIERVKNHRYIRNKAMHISAISKDISDALHRAYMTGALDMKQIEECLLGVKAMQDHLRLLKARLSM